MNKIEEERGRKRREKGEGGEGEGREERRGETGNVWENHAFSFSLKFNKGFLIKSHCFCDIICFYLKTFRFSFKYL